MFVFVLSVQDQVESSNFVATKELRLAHNLYLLVHCML